MTNCDVSMSSYSNFITSSFWREKRLFLIFFPNFCLKMWLPWLQENACLFQFRFKMSPTTYLPLRSQSPGNNLQWFQDRYSWVQPLAKVSSLNTWGKESKWSWLLMWYNNQGGSSNISLVRLPVGIFMTNSKRYLWIFRQPHFDPWKIPKFKPLKIPSF